MKSDFLKKIIAVAVITTTMGTFLSTSAAAVDFSTWQQMNGQSSGYWKQSGDNWYFYDSSGILQTGWIYDKGQWYYADASGIMQKGVIQVNGNIYLLSDTGAMQKGHAVVDGKYYTFDEVGVAVGTNLPTPNKAYNISGEATMPYTSNQVVGNDQDDSSPNNPTTVARDPQNLVKYDVTFKDDDGDDLRTKSIEKGEKVTLYTPTKNGYKFVEWTTKKNGDGDSYDSDDSFTVKKNITLYAQWEEVTDSGNDNSSDNVLVEDITITSDSSTISTQAGILKMSAKVSPIDASNTGVKWSVENGTGKATITDGGVLTASANGTVVVVATAKDSSKVTGKYSVTISGQTNTGGDTGGNTGGDTGGNTGGDTGGTTTGGKITTFDPNIRLTDVVLSDAGNIVDLALLKASGKLPTTAKVTCSLSDGTVKIIDMPITGWSGTFDGTQANSYILSATLGAIPTGYTSSAVLPNPTVKVIVQTPQVDGRTPITGVAQTGPIVLNTDKHIMNMSLLNSSGILPSKVTLNYPGGTVTANVRSWSLASGATFNGSVGSSNLEAVIDVPAGYVLPSNITVTTTVDVQKAQTANIQELVEVETNTGFALSYALDDLLDLSKLVVKVKYNDGTYGDIPYSQFADNNITTPGYFSTYKLTNITSFMIPVTFNNKTIYTERITVSQAVAPTVTTSGSVIFDATSSASNSDATFSYTLGTGTKKASGIQSITLNGVSWTLDNQYTIDTTNKVITIKAAALKDYYDNVAKTTPSTYSVNVVFTPVQGTVTLKPAVNPTIHFISTPSAPSNITLAPNAAVTAKDNTMRLLNLEANVQYEYCVVTTGDGASWTSAKSFASTTNYKELTDTSFGDGKELYIRKKSTTDGMGATNPASSAQGPIAISAGNIARTFSSLKTMTSFSVNYSGTEYKGTITEGSTSGTINVVVPTVTATDGVTPIEMPVNNLAATAVITGKSINGPFVDFTNAVTYTVTAEDGTSRNYTVNVIRTKPQATSVRHDTISYLVTTTDANNVTVTTTASVNILTDLYEKVASIDSLKDGLVNIQVIDTTNSSVLEKIRTLAPSTNPQLAYVGMNFTATASATNVKIAGSLDGLKTASAVSLSATGVYLETIPFAMYGGGSWTKLPENVIKYYQWLDSKGNVLGYTSLNIKVV